MAIIVSDKLRAVVPRNLEDALVYIERFGRLIAMAAESGERTDVEVSPQDFSAIKEAAWYVACLAEAAIDLSGKEASAPWDTDVPLSDDRTAAHGRAS